MRKTVTQTIQLTLAGAAVVALGGCSTMFTGAYEKVEIVTSPPGAYCKIYREGQGFLKSIATPGEKYIMRDRRTLTITCSKKGYKTATITDEPGPMPNDQGSVVNFMTAGAGFLVDISNDAHYQTAGLYEINLERL